MSVDFDKAADTAKAIVLPKIKEKVEAAIVSKFGKAAVNQLMPAVWPVVVKGLNVLLDELRPRVTIEGDGVIVGRLTL